MQYKNEHINIDFSSNFFTLCPNYNYCNQFSP